MTSAAERDTIPRLHRIVDHPADQLVGLAAGADTFEECRIRYGKTTERLALEGRGRFTAPRVAEQDRNWAPTRDLLQELIRWGAIDPAPLPSTRRNLESHRERRYPLTPKGRHLAEIAHTSRANFTTAVSEELLAAHVYFRRLLQALQSGPVICPVPTEGDVSRGRGGPAGWAEWAASLIGGDVDVAMIERVVREHLDRRFGNRAVAGKPTNKAIAETLTDAFAVAGFGSHGIHTDGPTIKTLQRWGTELLIFDQSRYVPSLPSANVLWPACELDFEDGPPRVRRRGRAQFGEAVAEALVAAFYDLQDPGRGIAVPVHRIRAQAAFESRVTRALSDLVLAELIDGRYPKLETRALAFIGSCELPKSEPAFRHRNRVRLEVQMVPASADPNRQEQER